MSGTAAASAMVANRRHVDIARFLGGTDGWMGINRGGGFHAINFSKRSIALDLSTKAGAEVARRLVAISDIVVENFAAGTMRRFGRITSRCAPSGPI